MTIGRFFPNIYILHDVNKLEENENAKSSKMDRNRAGRADRSADHGALILYFIGGAQLNKTRQVQPAELTIPTDDEALARGEHLVNATCKSCHGSDLSGTAILADPAVGTVYAVNISGFGERRTDQELVLAIRHGLG